MHLLAIAADAVGDLSYRNPRLARRWLRDDASPVNLLDVVEIRFGGNDRRTGSHHLRSQATELANQGGLWLTLDLATEPVKLTAGGRLDASTMSIFQEGVECCVDAAQGAVEVDLGSLRFMGVVGLRSLLEAVDRLTSTGSVVLVDPPAVIGRLLGSTGKVDVVPPRHERALSAVGSAVIPAPEDERGPLDDPPLLPHAAGT